jgi:hypothetical protein
MAAMAMPIIPYFSFANISCSPWYFDLSRFQCQTPVPSIAAPKSGISVRLFDITRPDAPAVAKFLRKPGASCTIG